MGKGGNAAPPGNGVPGGAEAPEMEALIAAIAEQNAAFLADMCGDALGAELRTNCSRGSAMEVPQFLHATSVSFETPRTLWVLHVMREQLIDKEELKHVATLKAHADLLHCKTDEEVLHWIGITGFILNPAIRAALYAAGFRPRLQVLTPQDAKEVE